MARNPEDAQRPRQLELDLPLDLAVMIYSHERVPDSVLEKLTQDIHGILTGWQYSSWTSLVEVAGQFTTEEAGQGGSEADSAAALDARPSSTQADQPPVGGPPTGDAKNGPRLAPLERVRLAIKSIGAGMVPSIEEYERNLEQTTDRAIAGLLTDQVKIEAAEAKLKRPDTMVP